MRSILQQQHKSQLSLLVPSLWITRLNLASLVSGRTTALYKVEMADNGVEPCTSTTATRQTFPMPTPHVANLVLVASSYVSAQLPTGEIGLHQLHWTCCVTEPIPLHTKTNPVEQQFPVHLQLNESKVRLSCSGGFE